jgi:hypothetical protein
VDNSQEDCLVASESHHNHSQEVMMDMEMIAQRSHSLGFYNDKDNEANCTKDVEMQQSNGRVQVESVTYN